MTQTVRDWLPDGAFGETAVQAALGECIAGWSHRWFAAARAEIVSVRGGAAAALAIPPRSRRNLIEAVLDVDLAEQPLGEADRRLFELAAQRIGEDLMSELGALLGPDDGGELLSVGVGAGGKLMLEAGISRSLLVPLMKRGLARGPGRTVTDRGKALRKSRVTLHGHAGAVDLSLEDLKNLNPGDVLVLDRALGEPIELRLTRSLVARGTLCRTVAGKISIQL